MSIPIDAFPKWFRERITYTRERHVDRATYPDLTFTVVMPPRLEGDQAAASHLPALARALAASKTCAKQP